MKIGTFVRNVRAKGHSVTVDRERKCATVTDQVSDDYRIDVTVHFDDDRNITHSRVQKTIDYVSDSGSHYAGGMAEIPLSDMHWERHMKGERA